MHEHTVGTFARGQGRVVLDSGAYRVVTTARVGSFADVDYRPWRWGRRS